jgi:hypothetical protein
MTRIEKALLHINIKGVGLEMGPSYNPILLKSSGAKIKTIDHLNREGLVQKYNKHLSATHKNLTEKSASATEIKYLDTLPYEEIIKFIESCDVLVCPSRDDPSFSNNN